MRLSETVTEIAHYILPPQKKRFALGESLKTNQREKQKEKIEAEEDKTGQSKGSGGSNSNNKIREKTKEKETETFRPMEIKPLN